MIAATTVIDKYKSYFDNLVDSIKITPCYITYNNNNYRILHQDYYSIILKDREFTQEMKVSWEYYVATYFNNKLTFNRWCRGKKNELRINHEPVYFKENDFNIYFMYIDNVLEAYTKQADTNFQLHYLTNSNKGENFWKECITHLQIIGNKIAAPEVPQSALIKALKQSVANKVHFIREIRKISNFSTISTHFYIALPKKSIKLYQIEAWDIFMQQFSTDKMKKEFMSWIYGIFYDKDYDRRMLWIEGSNETGKSSITNAIVRLMMKINKHSVKGLNNDKDLFKMDNFDKCRLVIISDLKNPNIFDNQVIYNITGGDYYDIREPHKAPRLVQIMAKVLITSNIAPVIDINKGDQVSRMLHITLDKDNVYKVKDKLGDNFRQRLNDQLPNFIHYCAQFYTKPPKIKKNKNAII